MQNAENKIIFVHVRLSLSLIHIYPRFKSKKKSTPKFYQDNIKIQFSDTHVKFEGFSSSRKANKQKLNWVRPVSYTHLYTKRFDGADINAGNIKVTKEEIDEALSLIHI